MCMLVRPAALWLLDIFGSLYYTLFRRMDTSLQPHSLESSSSLESETTSSSEATETSSASETSATTSSSETRSSVDLSGHKHNLSSGTLTTRLKKTKTNDIEDSSCPGFFPGCGSDVPCDECTNTNRLRFLNS